MFGTCYSYERFLVRHSLREEHQVAKLGECPLVGCASHQRFFGRLHNAVQLSTRESLPFDRLATMLSYADLF